MITLSLILISSSSANVFAENDWTQEQIDSGRYSESDPSASGVGEGGFSYDKIEHRHYYSINYTDPDSSNIASSVEASVLNGCDCVVFRLDDVQDPWLPDVQVTVMDQFVQKNQYLSVGPIVSDFGANPTVVNTVIAGYDSGLFEIFVHGWTHEDHTTFDLAKQTSTLQDSRDKLQTIGTPSTVFIPPFNAFNEDTLTAMQSTGFEILSAAEYTDSHPYFIADGTSDISDSLGLYHLPESIGFVQYGGEGPIRISNSQILAAIDSSIDSKGYAVVTLHSQEFAEVVDDVEQNSIDQDLIDDLNFVIDGILLKNYLIQTFNQVVQYNQFTTPDTEKPVITPGGITVSILVGSVYTEQGAIVTDNDPSYSEVVTVGGDTVDTLTPGDYIITYNAPDDAAGNTPDEQSITITVESDTEKPVIYPNGFSISIPFGSSYTELDAYVTDNDPAYYESVTIGGDTVDPFTSDDYTITYNAPDDAAGNTPDEQFITITVDPDYEDPEIYPNGFSTTISFGSSYTELDAYVTDNDPAYSESVTIGGDTVDPFTSGDYTITYNAPADATGNVPDEQTITITVLAQTGSNPCDSLPNSGDWIITSTCHLENDFTSPASVLVQNGAVLIIPDNVTLTILSGNNITIESGGGTLIKSGGNLQVDS